MYNINCHLVIEVHLSVRKEKTNCIHTDIYIVACQRGGVSDEPPWLRAATRHGPGTLYSVNRWTGPEKHKTYVKCLDEVYIPTDRPWHIGDIALLWIPDEWHCIAIIVISIDSLIIKKECKCVQTLCWTPLPLVPLIQYCYLFRWYICSFTHSAWLQL